jgi:phosphoenolpyruvate carboxykinase (ATP)
LNAALDGKLLDVEYRVDPIFGFQVPESCEGVPDKVLRPADTWEDPVAYREKYAQLAGLFTENFKKFADGCTPEIVEAGPKKENISALGD